MSPKTKTETASKTKAGATAGGATATRDEVEARFRKLMQSSMIASSKSGNPVLAAFRNHFDADPARLPTLFDSYHYYLWINRQAGMDAWLNQPGRVSEMRGVIIPTNSPWGRMTDLLLPPSFPMPAPRWGQIGEEQKEAGFQKTMRLITRALIFFRDEHGPGVLWVTGATIEVMAPTPERAGQILKEIRELALTHSPYRGQCVQMFVHKGVLKPQFMERPQGIKAEDVILPPGLLERVEEHVLGIAHFGDDLVEAKRHLKRGLLLWGRPGTGKTHTIRYLASSLPEHTVLILPGSRMEHLDYLPYMIEICQPGIVVLDDVDYIAEDRSMPSMAAQKHLYELLETLDGVTPDADLLFILTTNRADTIEPAIAARPGRVDQVAEIPPPDESCRRRLFDLYSRGVALEMDDEQIAQVIKRTEGVTGSFFKELLRRATLAAVDDDRHDSSGKLVVTNEQLTAALDDILDPASPLTAKMLGGEGIDHGWLGADDESAA